MASGQSSPAVLAAIFCAAAVTAAKFVAAFATGSAAMLAEGVHSLVDTGNSALLYLGMRLSNKPPDEDHPFGYGRELYFWTLVVALILFVVGGCASVIEGVSRIFRPHELTHLGWNYAVLGMSFVFNGITGWVAFREFRRAKGDVGYGEALKRVKDPSAVSVLFEDAASLVGVALAFLGIFLGSRFDLPVLDGVASVLIGLLLAGVAVGLVYQSKVLLIGESANPDVVAAVRRTAEADEAVEEVLELLTTHLAPQDILLNLKLRFRDDLDARGMGEAVDRVEARLRRQYPDLKRIFIEPGPVGEHARRDRKNVKPAPAAGSADGSDRGGAPGGPMIRCLFRPSGSESFGELPAEKLADALADREGTVWLDVSPGSGGGEEVGRLLRERFAFHPLALDDALQETHVPRVDDWGEYLYVVLHAAELAGDGGLALHEIDVFLGKNYLVSVHEGPAAPLERLWDRCRRQPTGPGAGRLLYALADAVADDYMHVVEGLDDVIDCVELEVFRRPRAQLVRRIFRARRALAQLRRVFGSLREVMNRLARDPFAVLAADERVYFRDVYDHLVRLYDIVEGLRDMAAGALDSYLSVTSNRINEVMRTLTVVNVLFMPLSFLAGFFGMNFFGDAFNVANPFPSAALFWVCVVLMAVTPLALLVWMVRRGMLRPAAPEEPDARKPERGERPAARGAEPASSGQSRP